MVRNKLIIAIYLFMLLSITLVYAEDMAFTTVEKIQTPCGNNICEETENPLSCYSDCTINIDTLTAGKNYSQAWFTQTIIVLIIGIGIFLAFKPKKANWLKQQQKRYKQ